MRNMNKKLLVVAAVAMLIASNASAITVSGTIADNAGWGGNFSRWTSPVFTPNTNPVTITGWVDLGNLTHNGGLMIGLIDKAYYEAGNSVYLGGASAFFASNESAVPMEFKVGPTDGRDVGGEIIQTYAHVPQSEGSIIDFAAVIGGGNITVTLSTPTTSYGPYVDTYGTLKDNESTTAFAWDEFEYGAILALDLWDGGLGSVDYSITAVPEPATMSLLGLGGLALIRRRNRK